MTLPRHLASQRQQLEELLALLHEERQLLAEGHVDGERLSELAEEKRTRQARLEKLEQQRRRGLTQLGYSDDRDGDKRAAADADCLALWRALRDSADRAADMNRGNGTMIGIRLQHNQRLLNALRDAAGKNLYGPDGRANSRSARVSSRA